MSNFNKRASSWDEQDRRVNGAKIIADAIKERIKLTQDMKIIDFGVGTGLLGFEIAKDVKQVYGVDTSEGMLQKLKEKNSDTSFIIPIHQDIINEPLKDTFDGLISSMTLHHIQNIELFFQSISKVLKKDAFIAIADLESEDGTFHSDNTGVHHFGFDEKVLKEIALKSGFYDITVENINTIKKPHGNFNVFLLTAYK